MKAYKIEVLIIDHDGVGQEGIVYHMENARYPNHCLSPHIKRIEAAEIGEWTDAHPLNQRATCQQEYLRIFGKPFAP